MVVTQRVVVLVLSQVKSQVYEVKAPLPNELRLSGSTVAFTDCEILFVFFLFFVLLMRSGLSTSYIMYAVLVSLAFPVEMFCCLYKALVSFHWFP